MTVRRRLAAVALVLLAPVVTSCGVNFGAQTEQVYNPAVGVDDRSGSVDVLNALVVSGEAGSGTVVATLVNNDQQRADALRDVTGAGSDASVEVTMGGTTTVKAAGLLNLATQGKISVRGDRVVPGNLVGLQFTFRRGQAVTLRAPVVSAQDPPYADVPLPSPTGSPSPSGSPSVSDSESPVEPSESPSQ